MEPYYRPTAGASYVGGENSGNKGLINFLNGVVHKVCHAVGGGVWNL